MSNDTELENSQESHGADNNESETPTIEQLQAENAELTKKNTQLYARVKKTDTKDDRKEQSEDTTQVNLPSAEVARLTLKVDGYNDAEIDEVMKLGGLDSLKNPLVKKAIDVMREERQTEAAQVTDGGSNSDFSRKYSESDLRKMSADELEKILPQS